MTDSKIINLFDTVDETTQSIQVELQLPYLDCLSIALEALYFGKTDEAVESIAYDKLQKVDLSTYEDGDMRRVIQLLILKGMQKATQQQHIITPDTIALMVGYFAEKLLQKKESVSVFDPVSGTGNLLITVLKQLKMETHAAASEVDETLLRLSLMYANLQETEIEFFHQDSLQPFLLDPVDLLVADLPVGYYPDDINAARFDLKAESGHSFAHYLLMEQSLNYTKPGGFLIFIIPESLFLDDVDKKLHQFVQKHAHIIGLIQLDDATFKQKKNKKSIFILQKKGQGTKDIKQPLLVQLPSFNHAKAMSDITNKMNHWFEETEISQVEGDNEHE